MKSKSAQDRSTNTTQNRMRNYRTWILWWYL